MKRKNDSIPSWKINQDVSGLLNACSCLDQEIIRVSVENKSVNLVTAVDNIGQNCLHFLVCSTETFAAWPPPTQASATVELQKNLVSYLVQKGALVDVARTTDGWTPLCLAVAFGLRHMVSVLLAEGASAAVRDHKGRSPAEIADDYKMSHMKALLPPSGNRVRKSRFVIVQQGGPPLAEPAHQSSSVSDPIPSLANLNLNASEAQSTEESSGEPTGSLKQESVKEDDQVKKDQHSK